MKTYTWMVIAALFTIAITWIESRGFPFSDWMDKQTGAFMELSWFTKQQGWITNPVSEVNGERPKKLLIYCVTRLLWHSGKRQNYKEEEQINGCWSCDWQRSNYEGVVWGNLRGTEIAVHQIPQNCVPQNELFCCHRANCTVWKFH